MPYLLIAGDRDMEQGGFSVRSRREGDLGAMDTEGLLGLLKPELEKGVPRFID